MSEHAARTEGGEPVGSVEEEAARLLDALGDWARRHHGHQAPADPESAPPGGRSGAAPGGPENPAECRLCPFCQLVAALRRSRPEAYEHLADAAASVAAALRELLAAADGAASRRPPVVERIDIG